MFSVKHSPELMTDIHKNGLLFSWAFMSWNDDALCCPCRTAVWGFIISQRTTSCRQHARSLSDFLFFFLNLPTTLKKFVYHHWCASHNLENCCYVRVELCCLCTALERRLALLYIRDCKLSLLFLQKQPPLKCLPSSFI